MSGLGVRIALESVRACGMRFMIRGFGFRGSASWQTPTCLNCRRIAHPILLGWVGKKKVLEGSDWAGDVVLCCRSLKVLFLKEVQK